MKKRWIMIMVLLLTCAMVFAAGKSDGRQGVSGDAKRLKIQFVGVFINEDFFKPVKRGMEEAGRDLGVDVAFTGDTGGDAEIVNRMIREAVDAGVDGIAVDIIHPTANRDAISYAMGKGVPVVAFNVDATNGGGPHLAFTQQDFVNAGKNLASYMASFIPAGSKVLLTQHDAGVSALEDRAQGIRLGLEAKNVSFIDLITTSETDVAAVKVEEALRANPDIKAVLATGQADTEGAGIAAKKLGLKLPIGGFDMSPQILNMIKAGEVNVTTDQQPYMQGYYPVLQLVLNLRYGLMPCNIDAGAGLVDSKNADQALDLTLKGYR
jgi:simple sugar transport system substrate-binding protein